MGLLSVKHSMLPSKISSHEVMLVVLSSGKELYLGRLTLVHGRLQLELPLGIVSKNHSN